MSTVTYTIYKAPNDPCGTPTQFVLNVAPEPGFTFVNAQVLQTEGMYVSEIQIELSAGSAGPPVMINLCNAPVVCYPDSQPLDIVTSVDGDPKKSDVRRKDYNQAEVGGGKKDAASA
ncbi:MAG: hypothetical protein H6608_12540 [Flavobacteriales bacterium]|nr:hypothetical protein [Bacteroidota bacterium]MCB9241960.1 hypothetical protein [Flavobacteriales bacterium]